MDQTNLVGFFVIMLLLVTLLNRESSNQLKLQIKELETSLHKKYQNIQQKPQYEDEHVLLNMDKERLENPLVPPLSRNMYTQKHGLESIPKHAVPINIKTRGDGGDYQQIGILYKEDIANNEKAPGNNTDSNILPLFGKPTYDGSSQWNYYTATDKNHQIKIPLQLESKDCTDERGCKEINNGDSIQVPAYNGTFTANIYKLNSPRYIPYVV